MPNTGLIEITELYVDCSYQVRNFDRAGALTAADCCGAHATTAVIDPSTKNTLYRCGKHKGQVRPGVTSRVIHKVPESAHA